MLSSSFSNLFQISLPFLAAFLIGYFLGSIPFGLLFTKLANLPDIRKTGSGNIGATNVLRTGRKDLALLTLIFDSGKAALAAFIGGLLLGPIASLIAGGSALIGHSCSIWLNFKGGKGIATFFGLLFFFDWRIGFATSIIWIIVLMLSKYSSLAGIISVIIAPILSFCLGNYYLSYLTSVLAIFSIWLHRQKYRKINQKNRTKNFNL